MKKSRMIKIVLATTIFGGLYTSHIVSAQENNTDKLHAAEIAVNEAFINQFPYGEQFTDEDGVLATRIKAPDTAVNTKPKGYEKEITRKVNYKDRNTGKTLSRVYQTIRFYGTYESEKGVPEILEKPEFTYEVGTPEVHKKEEFSEGKITPEIHEKGELEGAKPPILEVPEFNGSVSKKGDSLVFDRPEYKEEHTIDIPPVVAIPKKEEPKVPEEPIEETTQEKPKEPENTIPEITTPEIKEEKKIPQLPQTGESIEGGILGLAFASVTAAIFMLKAMLKEKVK
jgi:LPXTG-domain-containing protein cell wall anchor protein